MILAGCLPGAKTATTPATTPTPIDQALARIAALEGAVSNINSRIATLNPGEAVAQLRVDLDAAMAEIQVWKAIVEAQAQTISDLETAVANLQEPVEETEYVAVRWDFTEVGFTEPVDNITTAIGAIYPRTIKEAGVYDVDLVITNTADTGTTPITVGSRVLELILQPREPAAINTDKTDFYSEWPTNLYWVAPVFYVKVDLCRAITFTSRTFDFMTLSAGENKTLELVLELY